jgi:hypothetical protein
LKVESRKLLSLRAEGPKRECPKGQKAPGGFEIVREIREVREVRAFSILNFEF